MSSSGSKVIRTIVAGLIGVLAVGLAAAASGPTASEAAAFVESAEKQLLAVSIEQQRASWVKSTFITQDSEAIEAAVNQKAIALQMSLAAEAAKFKGLALAPELARKLELLKTSIVIPAPHDATLAAEETEIASRLEGRYGAGEYCPDGADKPCYDLDQLSRILADSRDPQKLLWAWHGWRTVSPPMRSEYTKFVSLANQGARELGYKDTGALWRSKYDMDPDLFEAELDRIWQQVKPLYDSLHCYVRARLQQQYGKQLVPDHKPIPAHLLGNMWGQGWGNIYPLVAPSGPSQGVDITALLAKKNVDERELVRYGERFFTSLGFDKLPDTFWQRSLFKKPADRQVVCHASAWDIDFDRDVRLKMCIEVGAEDFVTVHHELGHNYYQMAYREQPMLFRDSANDGFHEGIGDTLALSVTPDYLVKIGLLDKAPGTEGDIPQLLQTALEKVAFLPFGLLVDKWRYGVFSGRITPEHYNQAWWDLVAQYQGEAPPESRSESDFDPGAKYHVASNTPYMRYFLAHILQFQFHRALCKAANVSGPLYRCSIYGNSEAGTRLRHMLEMGLSRPWPEALSQLSGEKQLDATAIIDYFAPLKSWLDEQNKGQQCGW